MIPPLLAEVLSTVPDDGQVVEDIHVYSNWVLSRARRPALSTVFHGMPGLESPQHCRTWMGDRLNLPAKAVAADALGSGSALEMALGMSLLGATLPLPEDLFEGNAIDVCAHLARKLRTVFIGHFVEGEQWRAAGWPVDIVELFPRPGDIPWEESHEVLARAELVLITGLTLINGTFHEVVRRSPKALRALLGPTVPPSPVFFGHGIHLAGSTLVEDLEGTIRYCRLGGGGIAQAPGGLFRKVNLAHSDFRKEAAHVARTTA